MPCSTLLSSPLTFCQSGSNTVESTFCQNESSSKTRTSSNGTKIGIIGLFPPGDTERSTLGENVKEVIDYTITVRNSIENMKKAHPELNKIVLLTTAMKDKVSLIVNNVKHIDVVIHGLPFAAEVGLFASLVCSLYALRYMT